MHLFTVCLAALVACSLAAPTTTPVPILKQINKVDDDGSVTFGFESADGTFRVEKRTKEGIVTGKFGYLDETGEVKVVEYRAGENSGFQPTGKHLPVDVPVPVVPVAAVQNNPASTFQTSNQQLLATPVVAPPKAVLAVQNTPAGTSSVQLPVPVASVDTDGSDDQGNDAEWQSVDADEDGIPDTFPVARPVAVQTSSALPASTTLLRANQVPVPVAQPPQPFQVQTATHPQAVQFLLDQNAQFAAFQLGPNAQLVPFTFFPQQLNIQ